MRQNIAIKDVPMFSYDKIIAMERKRFCHYGKRKELCSSLGKVYHYEPRISRVFSYQREETAKSCGRSKYGLYQKVSSHQTLNLVKVLLVTVLLI